MMVQMRAGGADGGADGGFVRCALLEFEPPESLRRVAIRTRLE